MPQYPNLRVAFNVQQPLTRALDFINKHDGQTFVSEFENENKLIIDEIRDTFSLTSSLYAVFEDTSDVLVLRTDRPNEVKDAYREYIVENLANKRQKSVVTQLPDGSSIITVQKNRDEVYEKEGVVYDDTVGDMYYFASSDTDGEAVVSKNIQSGDLSFSDFGCKVAREADTVIASREYFADIPLVGNVADMVMLSTYSQGYPQILLCLL
jgi:hypothetical protein